MGNNKRMLFIFYGINLLFGMIVMLPLRGALNSFAGHSLMGEKLAGRIDMDFLFEFLINNKGAVGETASLLFIVAAVYGLSGLFLSGGAFSVFAAEGEYSSSLFWGSAAKYCGRFLRLFLWSLPVLVIFYCIQFVENGVVRLIFGKDPYQNIAFWGGSVRILLGYVGIILYYVLFDYARIYVVVNDERKTRVALWRGIKFIFRNFFKTLGLAAVLFVVGIVVLIIYNPLADALHAPNGLIVFVLFLLQQMYMLFRMSLKLTLYASQVDLYGQLSPRQVAPQPLPEPELPAEPAMG